MYTVSMAKGRINHVIDDSVREIIRIITKVLMRLQEAIKRPRKAIDV